MNYRELYNLRFLFNSIPDAKMWHQALALLVAVHLCHSADILMVTMGGTKSHKIPFLELARGLIPR